MYPSHADLCERKEYDSVYTIECRANRDSAWNVVGTRSELQPALDLYKYCMENGDGSECRLWSPTFEHLV